jgi:hypothetical protein
VNASAIRSAGEAAKSLRDILGMIQKAKEINEMTGWIPSHPEVTHWKNTMESARASLRELEAIISQNCSPLDNLRRDRAS